MTMGERIQNLRKQQGISQETLAEQLRVSRQAVSKWERDEAMPDTGNVVQLSKLFQVTTDYLLQGDSGNIPQTKVAKEDMENLKKPLRHKLKFEIALGVTLVALVVAITIWNLLRNKALYGVIGIKEWIFSVINLVLLAFFLYITILLVKALFRCLSK